MYSFGSMDKSKIWSSSEQLDDKPANKSPSRVIRGLVAKLKTPWSKAEQQQQSKGTYANIPDISNMELKDNNKPVENTDLRMNNEKEKLAQEQIHGEDNQEENDDVQLNMDLEQVLLTANMHIMRLHHIKKEHILLETSCQESRQQVNKAANDLVNRIQEHGKRLLEEIETRYMTEKVKLSFTVNDVDSYIDVLSQIRNHGKNAKHGTDMSYISFILHRDLLFASKSANINLVKLMNDNWNDEFSLPRLHFESIRSNTAFGSIKGINRSEDQQTTENDNSLRSRTPSPESSPKIETKECASIGVSLSTIQLPKMEKSPGIGQHTLMMHGLDRRHSMILHEFQNSSLMRRVQSLKHNKRTQIPQGAQLLWEITKEGGKAGELRCPTSVAFLPNQNIVVADKVNERLQVFDTKGKFVKVIGSGKIKPLRLCVTRSGEIAVTDVKDNTIKIFNADGQLVKTWKKKHLKKSLQSPCAIAPSGTDRFVVSDLEKGNVAFYQNNGKVISDIKAENSNGFRLQSPLYLTTDMEDRVIISDNWSHSVRIFDRFGEPVTQLTCLGKIDCLKYPNGVCTTNKGNILVADWGRNTVSLFDRQGEFQRYVVSQHDNIQYPCDLDVAGNLLVVAEYSDEHSAIRLFKVNLN